MIRTLALAAILSTSPAAASVQQMIVTETTRQIGAQWTPTALRIAKLESGFRCNATGPKTRQGRARGVFQVMPATARSMGYNPAQLHECGYGIAAGVTHMRLCIASGVRTPTQMASCHVAGTHGWKVRLKPRAERYKQKYVRNAAR
jgi:soluble lytic murein transglycosylase-like protein